jgi:hypothetical protein
MNVGERREGDKGTKGIKEKNKVVRNGDRKDIIRR